MLTGARLPLIQIFTIFVQITGDSSFAGFCDAFPNLISPVAIYPNRIKNIIENNLRDRQRALMMGYLEQ